MTDFQWRDKVAAPAKLPVTAIVAVKNEEVNLPRCLSALQLASRVIVADSGSQDHTVDIARQMGSDILQFSYGGGYPKKRQWVLGNADIDTPWVMLVDADEVIPSDLWHEVRMALSNERVCAYLVRKEFHFLGKRFRYGGFSHSAIVLFRSGKARFENLLENPPLEQDMEVHERLIVEGPIAKLKTPLVHEDFRGLDAYVNKHRQYASWEAAVRVNFQQSGRWGKDSVEPRIVGNAQEVRRFLKMISIAMPFEPVLWFLYHYVVKLGFLEGRRGLIASQVRSNYIREVRAKVYESQLRQAAHCVGLDGFGDGDH